MVPQNLDQIHPSKFNHQRDNWVPDGFLSHVVSSFINRITPKK